MWNPYGRKAAESGDRAAGAGEGETPAPFVASLRPHRSRRAAAVQRADVEN